MDVFLFNKLPFFEVKGNVKVKFGVCQVHFKLVLFLEFFQD